MKTFDESDYDKPVIPSIGADTIAIYQKLKDCKTGDLVTYEELSELVGRPIKECYHNLQTARRKALRENGQAWFCKRGVGIKCANGGERIDFAEVEIRAVGRKMRRTASVLKTTDLTGMSDAERLRYNVMSTAAAAIALVAKPSSTNKIEQGVRTSGGAIPDVEALKRLCKK